MPAPFSYIKGTFVDSSSAPLNGATIALHPKQTPMTVGGDVVVSDPIYVTLDSNGQFGQDNLFKVVTGYYRVVVTDVDAFDILVPNDSGVYDVKDLGVAAGAEPSLSVSGTDTASLALALKGGDSVVVSRSGDKTSPRTRFLLIADSTSLYSQGCRQLLRSITPDYVIGINMNPGGAFSTLEDNISGTFGPWIKDYSGPGGTGPIDQRFFYCLNSDDYNPTGTNFVDVKAFFQMPGNYYTQVVGDITFFILSSESVLEPDGATFTSEQGQWFQAQVASASTKYKVVVFAQSPVAASSMFMAQATWMEWPFADLGIDLIVTAGTGTSEYRVHNGVPMLIVGGMREELLTIDQPPAPYAQTYVHSVWTLEANGYNIEAREHSMGNLTEGTGYPTAYIPNKTAVRAAPYHLEIVASGGGSTLTSRSNGSANNWTFFPGITDFSVGDRILVSRVYDSSLGPPTGVNQGFCGIYQFSNLGSAGTPWVLVRAPDHDSVGEINGTVVEIAPGGHYSSGKVGKLLNTITTPNTDVQIWSMVQFSTTAPVPTAASCKLAFIDHLLSATYNAGAGTITKSSAGSINDSAYNFARQNINLSVGDRVLVPGHVVADGSQGLAMAFPGVYTVTSVGSGLAAWVLTRATDANTNGEMTNCIVLVEEGMYAGLYMKQVLTANLAGSDPLRWEIIAQNGTEFDTVDPDFVPGLINYSTTVLAKAGQFLNFAVKINRNSGLTVFPTGITDAAEVPSGGLSVDFGSARGQVLDGNDTFIGINEGRVVRLDSDPTVFEIRENGWWKNCLFLIGNNPVVQKVFDKNSSTLVTLATGPGTVAATQLVEPTLTPDELFSARYAVVVDHPDPLVTLMVSLNGGAFQAMADWPTNKVITWENETPSWLAVYATRSGYRDSEIVRYRAKY